MFTGIIEQLGVITAVENNGTNKTFWIRSALAPSLKTDQSVSHDGICLTVEEVKEDSYRVTAIEETLQKTTAGKWSVGQNVNLERSLLINSRLDGHFVQGHVDSSGTCEAIEDKKGSREFRIFFPEKFAPLVIEKGSIALNGISLTVFNVTTSHFTVAIIPYTLSNTNLQGLSVGQQVNLEFDIIGKYIAKKISIA